MKKDNLKEYKKQLESIASKDLAQVKGGLAAAPDPHRAGCW
jgi:hypothetical protein